MKIAIIGAGISAITIAQNLKNVATVSLFEKSRSVGGRMALRRSGRTGQHATRVPKSMDL